MKTEIAPSWHPGIAAVANFFDGRAVYDMIHPRDRAHMAREAYFRMFGPFETTEVENAGNSER